MPELGPSERNSDALQGLTPEKTSGLDDADMTLNSEEREISPCQKKVGRKAGNIAAMNMSLKMVLQRR